MMGTTDDVQTDNVDDNERDGEAHDETSVSGDSEETERPSTTIQNYEAKKTNH